MARPVRTPIPIEGDQGIIGGITDRLAIDSDLRNIGGIALVVILLTVWIVWRAFRSGRDRVRSGMEIPPATPPKPDTEEDSEPMVARDSSSSSASDSAPEPESEPEPEGEEEEKP